MALDMSGFKAELEKSRQEAAKNPKKGMVIWPDDVDMTQDELNKLELNKPSK